MAFLALAGASLAGTAAAAGDDSSNSFNTRADNLAARSDRLAERTDNFKNAGDRHTGFTRTVDHSTGSLMDTHDIRHASAVAERRAIKDSMQTGDHRDWRGDRDWRNDRDWRSDRDWRNDRDWRSDRFVRFHDNDWWRSHGFSHSFRWDRHSSLDSDLVLSLLALGCCRGYGSSIYSTSYYPSYYGYGLNSIYGYGLGTYGYGFGTGYNMLGRTSCTAEEIEAARVLSNALNERVSCREAFHLAAVLMEATGALNQLTQPQP